MVMKTSEYGALVKKSSKVLKGMDLSSLGINKPVYLKDSICVHFKNSGPSVRNYKVINKLSHVFCLSSER